MDDMDNILKNFLKRRHPADGAQAREACISEELFAEYLNNLLGPSRREQVEMHLDACEECFQKSIVFSRVLKEMEKRRPGDVSQDISEKEKHLTPADMIEVVLEFGKDIIHIIRDASHICTVPEPVHPSFRNGGDRAKAPAVVQLSKDFRGLRARISVEKTDRNECEIETRISDSGSGEPLDDIRVSLISGKRELASYLTVKGRASFKHLLLDTYVIKIIIGKDTAGSIRIKMSSIR